VDNGVVYVGSNDHNVYALNAATGAKAWSFATKGSVGYSSPAVAKGKVYVGSFGIVYALNASTGAQVWRRPIGQHNVPSSPAVANGVVYISLVNTLYGVGTILLDADTGVSLWHYPTGGVNSSPIVVNGRIYVAGPGEIDVFGLL
jgi:outer membrane protein assembly factor BamB